MLDELYRRPYWVERSRRSWLRGSIDQFLSHLAAQRFSEATLRTDACRLLAFGEFTAQQGVTELEQLPLWREAFVAQVPAQETYRHKLRLLVTRFLDYLRQQKVLPVAASPPPSPNVARVKDYLWFLREQRGLSGGTLQLRRRLCQALLAHLATEGLQDFQALGPDSIHRFLVAQGERCNRATMRGRCSMLRDFLGFLYRRGSLGVDLAASVVSPRVYQHEQCPRFLTRPEIEAVLAVIDRQSPAGCRDHAMVLLLASYGLRGIEVVRLLLDDIDWRSQLLYIRQRKAGNSGTYPLSVPVGAAIVAYLQQGRPASSHREVFLTTKAPFTPLASSACLATRVKYYLMLAGIRVAKPGMHSFRYACAQRLFEQGLPLKSISDYLGHRDPGTTRRYTMMDFDQLREVAAGDGEDLL
jgi:site-specific recombinase XerD